MADSCYHVQTECCFNCCDGEDCERCIEDDYYESDYLACGCCACCGCDCSHYPDEIDYYDEDDNY